MRHSYENVMEPTTGIEPVTPSLPRKCSTTEPRGPDFPDLLEPTAFRETNFVPQPPTIENPVVPAIMERETGLGPATLSLEG